MDTWQLKALQRMVSDGLNGSPQGGHRELGETWVHVPVAVLNEIQAAASELLTHQYALDEDGLDDLKTTWVEESTSELESALKGADSLKDMDFDAYDLATALVEQLMPKD